MPIIDSMQHHCNTSASLPATLRNRGLCSREGVVREHVVAFDLKPVAYCKLQFCCFVATLVASFLISWLTVTCALVFASLHLGEPKSDFQ